jgi:predicted ABC-type ATPase
LDKGNPADLYVAEVHPADRGYTPSMPDFLLIGGPNGAGKSTIAPALIRELLGEAPFVNADVIARGMAGPARQDDVAMAAGRRALERIAGLIGEGSSFAFESTLSSRSLARTLSGAKGKGYRVTLVYVWVPSPQVSVQRVTHRRDSGGHFIPPDVVLRRYARSLANLRNLYLPLADAFRIYDHSTAGAPLLVARGRLGRPNTVYDGASWQRIRRSMSLEEEAAALYDEADEEREQRILDAIRVCTGETLLKHKLLRQSIVTYDLDGTIFHIPPEEIQTHLTAEEEAEAFATAGHGTWFSQ